MFKRIKNRLSRKNRKTGIKILQEDMKVLKISELMVSSMSVSPAPLLNYYFDDQTAGKCYQVILDPSLKYLNSLNCKPITDVDLKYQKEILKYLFQRDVVLASNPNSVYSTEVLEFLKSRHSYINDLANFRQCSYDEIVDEILPLLHDNGSFLNRPNTLSSICHKATNGLYVTSSTIRAVAATSSSHMTGVTGTALIVGNAAIIIIVPLIGGIFFASLERLSTNTVYQTIFGMARDVCLLVPKVTEVAYNEFFIGAGLRRLGIDAPLNVTSMLGFGKGPQSKLLWPKVVDNTENTLINSMVQVAQLVADRKK